MVKITKEFVEATLELADNGQSKLSERERELFGISSARLRALINNICSKENTTYLELGTYRGATLISAMFGNPTCKAVGVENFKYDEREPKKHAPNNLIWDNMKSQLEANIERYKNPNMQVNVDNITIIQSDFEEVDWKSQPKFDVCFYDVTPTSSEKYDTFFEKVLQSISSEGVLIFSSYSNELHAKELDAALVKHADKFDVTWKQQRISGGLSDSTHYYSGILIVGIKKKLVKAPTRNAGQ